MQLLPVSSRAVTMEKSGESAMLKQIFCEETTDKLTKTAFVLD